MDVDAKGVYVDDVVLAGRVGAHVTAVGGEDVGCGSVVRGFVCWGSSEASFLYVCVYVCMCFCVYMCACVCVCVFGMSNKV